MALLSRLAKCNGPDWGHRFTCRSPACPACRDRYIGDQRRKAERRFANVPNSEMAMVTINLGAVRDVAEIEAMVAKARRDLRNMIDAQRRASGLWAPVEVLLFLETDAFDAEDFPQLGPDKQTQTGEFIQVFSGSTGVVWLPSLHGVVRFGPTLDIGRIRAAFEKQWPGHRRVDVRPFFSTRLMKDNLGDIINYSLKHEHATEFIDRSTGEVIRREWETKWLGEYYAWLYRWSRSFKSIRLTVKAKKISLIRDESEIRRLDVKEIDSDPLPVICSFSVFPTDYTYW